MRLLIRFAAVAAAAALLASCGKSAPETSAPDVPLTFVPADTPYVYANLEPTPAAVTEQWSKKMQSYWPVLFGMYQRMLTDAKHLDERQRRIATTLLDEIKTRDSWDKLRELGFKPDMRIALYGVGLVPVLRIELGDAQKFRDTIARIEAKVGEKLGVAKTGNQEYWQIGNDKLSLAIALEGSQLVVTLLPANANDALKQALLGVTRPAQNLAAAGTLQALAKQYKYLNFGSGYIDAVRLTERLSAPAGTDQEFATALGEALPASDAACRAEYVEIAHKFPRLVIGTEELQPQKLRIGAQLEIEAALAQQIMAASGAAPGSGAPGQGVIDISVALPLLKLKNFWIAQADAVAAKPFVCPSLTHLNASFRDSKSKLDTTLPPPLSDLSGVRFTLTRLEWRDDNAAMPDVAGKLLMGSNNPMAALAMAQLTVPPLKDVKLAADAKPVALPALVPTAPPLFAAMSDKAIAISAGSGEEASLSAFLTAPAATTPVFMRMYFSGAFYGMLSRSLQKMSAKLGDEQRARLEDQTRLFALYEQWIRSGELTLNANAGGIGFSEIVEMNTN